MLLHVVIHACTLLRQKVRISSSKLRGSSRGLGRIHRAAEGDKGTLAPTCCQEPIEDAESPCEQT